MFEINDGKQISPDDSSLTFVGKWRTEMTSATFGHVYAGEANATLTFKFTGTRLALLSSEAYGKDFEVIIDGQKVSSIALKEITNGSGVSFISNALENKEHTVVVKCLGNANIDSVVTYP